MLPASALQSMNVLWATPCYISAVSMNYVTSMFELTHEAIRLGLRSTLHLRAESLVTRARNEIVKFFLMNEQYTHLFWIDSDIAFQPAAVIRLLLSDLDVAAGIYPIKRFNWPQQGLPAGMTKEAFETVYTDYPFNLVGLGAVPLAKFVTPDDFIDVAEAPTGFMVVKRQVFTKLMAHYPQLNYVPDGPPNNPEAPFYWLFFDCMIDPDTRRYLSEDYAFCRRWRDIGGKVHVDLHSDLGHLGQHMSISPRASNCARPAAGPDRSKILRRLSRSRSASRGPEVRGKLSAGSVVPTPSNPDPQCRGAPD